MIVADLVRGAAFATLPLAAAFDALSLAHLYVVAAVSGIFSVLFDVAYQSYLPTLLTGEPLAQGNARLEMSSSVSRLTGPTIGGALLQALAATGALAANALSFLASVVGVLLVRTPEPAPPAHATSTGLWRPIAEGLHFLWHHPLRRPRPAADRIPGLPICNALVTTLRQQVTEPRLLGRVHAAARTINLSTIPLGALAGGTLAQLLTTTYGPRLGLTLALTSGAAVAALSLPILVAGRIRRIQHSP
jgi:hypothetical protein